MSNVIDFLERMGQDADLRNARADQLERALVTEKLSAEVKDAIVQGDPLALEQLAGARSNICAIVFPVEESERTISFQSLPSVRLA